MSLGLVILEEKLFMRMRTLQSDAIMSAKLKLVVDIYDKTNQKIITI